MTSHWQQTASDMFETCYRMKHNFPVPASCSDEQLYEFWYEINYKWSVNDDLITSGRALNDDVFPSWEQMLIEQCCAYEDTMETIEYEIERRSWLKDKPWPMYVGGKRCNK